MTKETRTLDLELKAADETTGVIEGYASTYHLDLQGDRVVPGAFAKTIVARKGKIPILRNHQTADWVGHTTLLEEKDRGLYFKGQLFMDTEAGRDTYFLIQHLLKLEARPGLSIGYNPVDVDFDKDVRLLKELDLWECSLTPFPAQPRAYVTAAKTFRQFEQSLRDVGFSHTDAKRAIAAAKTCPLFSGGTPAVTTPNPFNRSRLLELLQLRSDPT